MLSNSRWVWGVVLSERLGTYLQEEALGFSLRAENFLNV